MDVDSTAGAGIAAVETAHGRVSIFIGAPTEQ